jgi:hypothetical protein
LTPDELKQQTHALFLSLYYQTPVLRDHASIRVPVGSKKIVIEEPTDAILVLLETLSESGEGFCIQGKLEDLVRKWYSVETSSSFDKSLAMLDNAKCISKEPNPSNKRQNKLRLTPRGKRVCAMVKADRTRALKPLLRNLEECPPAARRELRNVLSALVEIAESQAQDGASMAAQKKRAQN